MLNPHEFQIQILIKDSAMPNPYSVDLRWRIMWLYTAQHLSTAEISQLVCVSTKTVKRYIRKFELTGEVLPAPNWHGPKRLLGDFEQLFLLQTILRNPGIYLHEIRAKLLAKFGVPVGSSTICKTLKHMGCSRQVIQHVAIQRNELLRAKFMAEISTYDPSTLIWIDESGCDRRHSTRKWGYSLRGMTPRDQRLLVRGTRYSAVPVVSVKGILDLHIIQGTMTGERFEDFISSTVLPILQPFNWINPCSVVIMDNASIHHTEGVADLIENQAGACLIYLPPYSPDLNPAEEVFSEVKSIMKQNDYLFQVTRTPRILLAMAFTMVTCKEFIRHSGCID